MKKIRFWSDVPRITISLAGNTTKDHQVESTVWWCHSSCAARWASDRKQLLTSEFPTHFWQTADALLLPVPQLLDLHTFLRVWSWFWYWSWSWSGSWSWFFQRRNSLKENGFSSSSLTTSSSSAQKWNISKLTNWDGSDPQRPKDTQNFDSQRPKHNQNSESVYLTSEPLSPNYLEIIL